jgi:membrane protease YdiL (CAAX protease family)
MFHRSLAIQFRVVIGLLRKIWSQENELWLADPPTKKDNTRTLIILVWVALGLAITEYWGNVGFVIAVLKSWGATSSADSFYKFMYVGQDARLHSLCWWSGTIIFVYFVVPAMITRFIFKMKLSDMGLKLSGSMQGWPLYVIMLCVMIPIVIMVSGTDSFQARYPFYKMARGESMWPNFIIWEVMYFIQFASLEFFFRGFITLGTRKSFGYMSIFVMMVPYCMIHFGKPMPETIGAIIAGIVLGTLALKSRSVILGIMIHYSVAITMDLMALWRK